MNSLSREKRVRDPWAALQTRKAVIMRRMAELRAERDRIIAVERRLARAVAKLPA
jgi:hypothetical protein